MKKIILPIVLIILLVFSVFVSAEVDSVIVEGRMVSMITGEPVPDMDISKWDGTKLNEKIANTDSDGKFSVTFNIDEVKSVDRGDGQSNYYYRLSKDCYVGADVLIYKTGSGWSIHIPQKNENIASAIPVTSSKINVRDIPTNSLADFELESDTPVKFAYTWKYLTPHWVEKYGDKWKGGSYDFVFNTNKQYTQYFPVNSYVRIRLSNKGGDVYVSPVYKVESGVCKKAKVSFRNKEFSSNLATVEGVVEGPFDDNGYILPVHKGWNLLPLEAMEPLSRSQLQTENFRGAHFYITPLNQYLSFKPEEMNMRDSLSNKLMQLGKDETWMTQNIDVFYNLAGWFYSKRDGEIVIRYGDAIRSFDGLRLYSGWNFKIIPPFISEDTYLDIKGDCNIERIASWDVNNQKWIVKTFDEASNEKLSESLNQAILFKISSGCILGGGGESSLPGLPSQDNTI